MNFKSTAKKILQPVISRVEYAKLPRAARDEDRRDSHPLSNEDPGIEAVVTEGIDWLRRAQDCSPNQDGGVARHYSLVRGWGASYPETTGYIVPTMLAWHKSRNDNDALERARRMLDWFKIIQFDEGGFQGGIIGGEPRVPVTFNTGQILLGLAAGAEAFGDTYCESMHKAAQWLRDTADDDGAWRKHPTPFAKPGEKTYETHVAWGLLEADRVAPGEGYGEAGLKNIYWALGKQQSNGWFADCCLSDPKNPLTHTIGYVLRGILEGWRFSGDEKLLESARTSLDQILRLVSEEGRLPGRLDESWSPAVDWVCLTGNSQIAHCFLMVYQDTGDNRYLEAGRVLNRFVRRTVRIEGDDAVRGAVKGAFPVSGGYGEYEYLNWAAKFTIDSNLLEQSIVFKS